VKDAPASFARNQVLFGRDDTPAILAVEPRGQDQALVYRRVNDAVAVQTESFQPFLWLAEQVYLQGFDRRVEYVPLDGSGELKFLARFGSWSDFLRACQALAGAPFHAFNDPVQQYLVATGRTLFKGMRFEQLRRMQIHVETDADGRLRAMLLADSRGWSAQLSGAEKHILAGFVEAVADRDPDALEGHDLFRVIFPRLAGRARACRVRLGIGRDGSAPAARRSRVQIAERTVQYPRYQVHGRHLVDTFLLTLFYDVSTRELEGFDLEEVAEHFGFGEELRAAPHRAAGRISELLGPSYFFQAQIFPYNHQEVIVRGNATKIDALLLREYLHQRRAVPARQQTRAFAGGYTDVFHEGIVRNVWHCDVQSLYPSLILAHNLAPRGDALNLFVSLLRELRAFRLQAKAAARAAGDDAQRRYFDALQQTFKILINSFYGYLGFSQAHFGDVETAARVTALGRETLKRMLDWLRQRGAHVIEIDTDGLYFVPPAGVEPEALQRELQAALPAGVDVEIDGRFPAMFSYKMKNYALLDEAGRLHIRGSALRSRGLEKFQRCFLAEALRLTLQDRGDCVPELYRQYREKLRQRQFPLSMLAKTDTLQDSLEMYRQKIARSARNRSAAYELALRSGKNFQPGDRIAYYVTGAGKHVSVYENCRLVSESDPGRRDENLEYYLDKLESLYNKFAPLLGLPPGCAAAREEQPRLL
jgi:DNA polymerase I